MKTPISFFIASMFICIVLIISCKKKTNPPQCDGKGATYNTNIKAVINTNCASSSCHPSFNTYQGMREILNNGKFREMVLETKQMPKGRSLSSDDLIKIRCWADAGFPEN
jgi:hypothetical protein